MMCSNVIQSGLEVTSKQELADILPTNQCSAAMAFTTALSGHCLQHRLPERRLQLPHQLTTMQAQLLVQRPSVRWQHNAAVVSSVAVPLPPPQPESPARRLRRTGSQGLENAAKLLRTLSSKFASAPEGTVQQVRRAEEHAAFPRCALYLLCSIDAWRAPFAIGHTSGLHTFKE